MMMDAREEKEWNNETRLRRNSNFKKRGEEKEKKKSDETN